MKTLTRQIENHKFYSNVYATKSAAQSAASEGYSAVLCFKIYGDPANGWMNASALNAFQEDSHTA